MSLPTYSRSIALLIILLTTHTLFGQWATYAPMPTARWGNGVVSEGGRLYSVSGNSSTAMESYNPATNTWQTHAAIPTFTAYPAIAAWNGKIYVIGGANGSTWLNNNQIYDIATNTWSAGAPIPSNRMGGSGVAYNGRIYVSHGWNGALLNSLAIYDIATDTWSVGASAPQARYQTGAGLIGSKMYVVGGYTSTWVGTNEVYDIPTNTWTTATAAPTARYLHAVGASSANIHIVAGYAGGASNSYQSYDPVTNLWTFQPNAPTARYRTAGAVLNGCMYVAGGFNGSVTVATLEGFCGLGPLDASSVSLFGQMVDGAAQLSWEYPAELEALTFTLERRYGQDAWVRVAMLNPSEHNWTDFATAQSMVEYRLRWVGEDGEVAYSNTVLLTTQIEEQGSLVYDPLTKILLITPANPAMTLVENSISLYSTDGRLIRTAQLEPGYALEWSMDGLAAGIYVIGMHGANGASAQKIRIH